MHKKSPLNKQQALVYQYLDYFCNGFAVHNSSLLRQQVRLIKVQFCVIVKFCFSFLNIYKSNHRNLNLQGFTVKFNFTLICKQYFIFLNKMIFQKLVRKNIWWGHQMWGVIIT